jgi:hypothetical protein
MRAASLAPPPQHAEFKRLVAAELNSLPAGMLGWLGVPVTDMYF